MHVVFPANEDKLEMVESTRQNNRNQTVSRQVCVNVDRALLIRFFSSIFKEKTNKIEPSQPF